MKKIDKFIPLSEPDLSSLEKKYLNDAIDSGWISSLGQYVQKFENEFSEFCNTSYSISTSNGTTALHLCLETLNLKKNDEVIVPSLTFIATASAVVHAGATPVFVDVDYPCGGINVELVRKAINSKTKAIIAVHLYGVPADMDELIEICKNKQIVLIEDAAEAHGAMYKNRPVGSMGTMNIFSFYGNKIITTGEGGMITTNSKVLYTRLKFLRDHAMDSQKRYFHPEIGYNYRLTNLQSAIGCAQLSRLYEILSKKNKILLHYKSFAKKLDLPIQLNPSKKNCKSVPWLICMLFKDLKYSSSEIRKKLKKWNIDSRPYFIPMHLLPPFKDSKFYFSELKNKDQSISEYLSLNAINLPSSSNLSIEKIEYVLNSLYQIINE